LNDFQLQMCLGWYGASLWLDLSAYLFVGCQLQTVRTSIAPNMKKYNYHQHGSLATSPLINTSMKASNYSPFSNTLVTPTISSRFLTQQSVAVDSMQQWKSGIVSLRWKVNLSSDTPATDVREGFMISKPVQVRTLLLMCALADQYYCRQYHPRCCL
jgi:hypothetical protein